MVMGLFVSVRRLLDGMGHRPGVRWVAMRWKRGDDANTGSRRSYQASNRAMESLASGTKEREYLVC